MPTDAFLEYIEEFEEVLEEAMKDIRSISSNKDESKQPQLEGTAKASIAEAAKYLVEIEKESNAGNAADRKKMQAQLRTCKSKMNKLRGNFQKSQLLADSGKRHREAARNQGGNERDNAENYQRRLDKTGDYLTDARRVVASTEQVALNIDNNLTRQREQLVTAQGNVAQTRVATQEASGHISSLGRKAFTNAICLYVVIILLLGGIGYIGYTKVKEDDPTPAPTPAPTAVPDVVPVTDAPVTEAPGTEEPVTEEPVTEEPTDPTRL